MQDLFIQDLRNYFKSHHFTETFSSEQNIYVQEIKGLDSNGYKIKYTILTGELPIERYFKIYNSLQAKIAHICIDGDFVPYGKYKYDNLSANLKDGRPESMLFDNQTLVFLELKVEQEEETFGKEDVKWKKFFEGVAQISDFVAFLRNNSFEVKTYFANIYAVVCMRFEPNFRSNAKRNNEIFKRSKVLGFPILAHNHTNYFEMRSHQP